MTADLRAGIEALCDGPFIYRLDNGHTNIGTPTVVLVSDLEALLAAHPVQDEDVRSAVSVWLTLALDIRSDGPSVADLLMLRDWIDGGCVGDLREPDAHPVQVTTAEHDPRCERRAHDGDTPCVWRERACVENWSGCESGEYNPACCRFPKSCSVLDVEIPAVTP